MTRINPKTEINPKIKGILFDLDGTLANSFPSIIIAFREAFKFLEPYAKTKLNFTDDEIKKLIGIPHQQTFKKIANDNAAVEKAAMIFGEMRKKFMVNAIDGSIDLLNILKTKNFKLGIVTTTGRELTERILNDLDVQNLFEAVITGTDVLNLKPHPEPILKAIEILNLSKDSCVMVGDHPNDIIAANSAEIKSIAILYAHTKDEFERYNPTYIVSSIGEIKNIPGILG
ncbi:putative Pyrophosphatase PpaX [groundwater metagenome]|uniref:Putative Pyrophosphatase PpaX n=1 Tax=groundwater metagenome TaxID=717931 RepID=A0A098E9T9_9ZZZZ